MNRDERSVFSPPAEAPTDNATFATQLCNSVDSSTLSWNIPQTVGYYFTIPECFANAATNLVSLTAAGVHIPDFAYLPASIQQLMIGHSYLGPGAGNSTTTFDSAGNILWPALFSRFNTLSVLSIDQTNLQGSLTDAVFPTTLDSVTITNSLLSGTLPSTMFTVHTTNSLQLVLNNNHLTGVIPEDLIGSVSFITATPSLVLAASGNQLTGTIPPTLLYHLGANPMRVISVDFSYNQLDGTIPTGFLPSGVTAPSGICFVYFEHNKITGTLPTGFLANLSSTTSVKLDLSNNQMSGLLPSSLFPAGMTTLGGGSSYINITLSNNRFSGTIPDSLLTAGLTGNVTFNSFVLMLDSNKLSGPIPQTLLYAPSAKKREYLSESLQDGLNRDGDESSELMSFISDRSFSEAQDAAAFAIGAASTMIIKLDSNELTGAVPIGLFSTFGSEHSTVSYSAAITLSASQNLINGLPSDLLDGFLINSAVYSYTLNFSGNYITQGLPASCDSTIPTSMDLSNNQLYGSIPTTWPSCHFTVIDISNNTNINGSIPPTLFTYMTSFSAAKTSLVGPVPTVALPTGFSVDLSFSTLDLCAEPSVSSLQAITGKCSLNGTSACNCSSSYVGTTCTVDFCSAPLPSASPVSCPESTRPTLEFQCVDGIWTASSTNATTLVIPAGAGIVVISGNLTSTSIVMQGTGNTVQVGGCASNLTSIEIQLEAAELAALKNSKTIHVLITTGSDSCASDLNSVSVNSKVRSGCKKVKTTKVVSEGGSNLGALFALDTSGCNTWWIILVSVICGLILLVIIAVILLAVFYKPFRVKIRPFSARQPHAKPLS